MTPIYFYYSRWMKWKLLLGVCRDERSGGIYPVGGHGGAVGCSRLSNDCRFVAAWCLSWSHTEGERAGEREGEREKEHRQREATGHIGNSTFDISHIQLRFTRLTSRGQGDHTHVHTHTHTHTHKHTCTYTQHICPDTGPHQGWHLRLSAAMAGYLCWEGWWWGEFSRWLRYTVYQTEAVALSLHEPILLSSPPPPPYICLSVVLFLGTHPLSLPPRCSLCFEMPPDCSSLSHFPPTDVYQPSGYL